MALRGRIVLGLAALSALAAGAVLVSPAGAAQPDREAAYIVVLKDAVGNAHGVAAEHARHYHVQVGFVYEAALKGYAARMNSGDANALRSDPRVDYVELDGPVHADAVASWGLDRIDQRSLPLSGSFSTTSNGAGVTAYVIDTGIALGHNEFGGRATSGWDFVDNDANAADCDGHGTHVAGTVGGATVGVASAVSIVAVRVLNCSGSGSWSGVIAGVDWVKSDHVTRGTPAVANMSLGGGGSTSVDQAVRNSINSGVGYAVAAGNGNQGGVAQDACKSSPARVAEAMTTSATDSTDRKASWANHGKCVDWFAPGVGIKSSVMSGGYEAWSGTSMATPHTAGVAALYLQTHPTATAQAVRDALYVLTTKAVVTSSKTTNNHLLYTNL